jgi:hypothetical protein
MWGNSAWAQRKTQPHSAEALGRIDAHAHLFKDAPVLYELFDRLNIHILIICVVDKYERGTEEAEPQSMVELASYSR